MSPERHALIKETYLQVCDFEETLAKERLQEICGNDQQLRKEVLSLLSYRSPTTIALAGAGVDLPETLAGDATKFGGKPNVEAESWVGRQLGRYKISRVLGIGGMGIVLEAHDKAIDRRIAIKVLHSNLVQNEAMRLRFLDEARAAGRLNHPHVVLIYEVDDDMDIHYLVMEYVDGGSTDIHLQRMGPYSVTEATRIAAETCLGLTAAHAHGLVHRDIKPANLLLTKDGAVKISDFGIAKLTDGQSLQQTEVGQLVGTPHYMSPEQCEEKAIDQRSDLYALGGTFFSLLVGRPPFEEHKSLLSLMNAHSHADRPNPCALNPKLPRACQTIVAKAMAVLPEDRYQSAEEMRQDLESLQASLSTEGDSAQRLLAEAVTFSDRSDSQAGPSSRPLGKLWLSMATVLLIGLGAMASHFSDRVARTVVVPLVEINIAYSTEKNDWLEWAAEEYRQSEAGKLTQINLIGMGSVQSARAVINGTAQQPIHVWAPASSAYREVFEHHWQVEQGNDRSPILKSENLALTPMVFVIWKDRYEAMLEKYETFNFLSIEQAMADENWAAEAGTGAIATKFAEIESAETGESEWGRFKFGHAHPQKSNSGMLTLAMLAYGCSEKQSDLTLADVNQLDFQTRLEQFEKQVTRIDGKMPASTGNLAEAMIFRGPSLFDCVMVYENLAIANLQAAQGRWEELHIVYPKLTIWNENPYYILDVPWSNQRQRDAAESFLEFLLSERIQQEAVTRGFRPGNINVPVRYPESPFVKHAKQGVVINILRSVNPPSAEVLDRLLMLK